MPNHFHGILWIINADQHVGEIHDFPLQSITEHRAERRRMSLPKVIGYFKMNSAKQINLLLGRGGTPFWQRNYYERVIRNEDELNKIRSYILNNPAQWELDKGESFNDIFNNS